ncbi:histidine kinase [Fluviicola sp.]|uniref:sensor histidine kinase n=1 Tax=Fluviicola sp. TaxID=1917219 RepID=UPI0031D22729
MIRSFFCGFLFLGIAITVFAQENRISWEYNYDHFGIKNGLPSSETYQVHQDKSGLLWILTDRGVVRYDGFQFKTYTTENGLCDNVNFRMVEGLDGGIWFIGFNGLLSVYKKGEMKPYRYNPKIQKSLKSYKSGNIMIHVNRDGSIIYNSSGRTTVKISKKGRVTNLMKETVDAGYLMDYGGQLLLQKTITTNDFKKVFLIRGKKKIFLGKIVFNQTLRAKKHKQHYFVIAGSKAYLHDGYQFRLISGNQSVIGLDTDDQYLYIGFYKNGVKKYRFDPKTKELVFVRHYFPNYSVSSVSLDHNGALWFTTLENGIYVIYDEAFQQLYMNKHKLNEEIRFVNGNKNKIILTYHVGKWQQLYPPFLQKEQGRINHQFNMLPANNGFIFHKGVADWSDWKDVDDSHSLIPLYKTDTSFLGVDQFAREIVEVGKSTVTRNDFSEVVRSGITGSFYWFHFYRKDKLFMLFDDGVFVLPVKDGKLQKSYRPVLLKRLDRLIYNRVWGLLAYSTSEGAFEINEETNRAVQFAPDLNLGKQIIRIFFDEKDQLWLANKKGIFLLEKKNGKAKVLFFVNRDRLSSPEIMDMYAYEDVLYLATKFGVQRINVPKVKKKQFTNPISLLEIKVFANNRKLERNIVYPSETDLIKIFLMNKGLDGSNHYRYRFGANETWNVSDKGEIVLNNPSDKVYALEVSYLDSFNHWTKPVKLGVFEVEKIIFLRWYFILLYIGLVVLVFYGILKYTVRAANRKSELLNRMMELEQMALSAQMNPHFIFNSLNSIHSFLLYEENENAEKYLLRFAKLIRQTLSNSRATYITIEEEYETLKNYILLENMRFKNGFTFRIECDFNQLPLNPCIPPMLIQPYVENAIIHGLPKRTQGAELLIRFYKEGDRLKVMIRDNGIGYKESQRNKRDTGHKSYGTQITEERMKSLQERNREGFSVEVSDADESNPEFPGTKVILTIPI